MGIRLAPLALIALFLLSGCSSKATTDTITGAVDDLQLEATATTGVIRGVVVDEGIRPLAGVLLTATSQGSSFTANSTSTGSFGFQGLPPGTYFVKAHKLGFRDTQVSTEVHAGVSDPHPLKVLLSLDSTYVKPYASATVFKGFIECGVVTPGVGIAVCSIPNGTTCGNDPVPCSANVTSDNFSMFIAVDGGVPLWIQHELVWDATQAAGNQFSLVARTATAEGFQGGSYEKDLPDQPTGESPLLAVVNTTTIKEYDIGRNGTGLAPAVFTGGVEGTGSQVCAPDTPATNPFCAFDTGVTLEQDFTMYTHVFYGFLPPEGYRFSNDGEPVPPQ
ncbi:MAG: carboxypeptidase-like regulatory domain-containing protein [Halobacteriales archaeon]|nr:carboxypeptidase-like regulatory domain-containing protein [Halobacteriales archaeon]